MKRSALFFVLLLATILTMAQNKIKRYEYWTDNDFDARVVTNITPVENFNLQAALSLTQLGDGFHFLNLRFIDNNNTASQVVSKYFMKYPSSNPTNKNIVGYEYWLDNNFAGKIYQPVNPSGGYHLATELQLEPLSTGLHILNLRFRDNLGGWSQLLSKYFMKYPHSNTNNKKIVAYEYWVDNNLAGKIYQPVTPSETYQLVTNLNLDATQLGFHILNLRFKDDYGEWSNVITHYFMRYSVPVIIPDKIVSCRLWYDNDPATMEIINLQPPSKFYRWADTVETPLLTIGAHEINYQFMDSSHTYSVAKTDSFYVASCLPHSGRFIAGPASVCIGQAGVVYSIRMIKNASGYTWTVPEGAAIVAGANTQSIIVDYSLAAVSGAVTVYATNSCGDGPLMTQNVTVHPLPHPGLSGNTDVCRQFSNPVYETETGMSNYIWTVSPGNNIVSGGGATNYQAAVQWNTTGLQWIRVNYTDTHGCTDTTATQLDVFVKPLPVPVINGLNSVCATVTGVQYTTETGMSDYVWTVSTGGAIVGSVTGNSVSVNWNTPGSRWVKVIYTHTNGCRASVPTQYNVTVKPLPVPSLSGNVTVCLNSQQTYTTENGKLNYQWTVTGGTITGGGGLSDHTATVTWNVAGNQTVSVSYTDPVTSCTAGSPAVLNVFVNSAPEGAGEISGPVTVDQGQYGVVYSITPVLRATGYNWTLPPGAVIASGANTNSITVNFSATASSGNMHVYGTNVCYDGPVSPDLFITVDPLVPVTTTLQDITVGSGQTKCYNATQTINVAGNGKTFIVEPTGSATLIAGQNILFYPGTIVEPGGSLHGYIAPSGPFCVSPSITLQDITVGNQQTKCYNALQTIYVAGNGTIFIVQSGGNATIIAGQNILFYPGAVVEQGGSLHGYITTNGQYCGNFVNPLVVNPSGQESKTLDIPEIADDHFARIYPNPTSGVFTIELSGKNDMFLERVDIYGLNGTRMCTEKLPGERKHQFSISTWKPGIYFIHIVSGPQVEIVKVVKL